MPVDELDVVIFSEVCIEANLEVFSAKLLNVGVGVYANKHSHFYQWDALLVGVAMLTILEKFVMSVNECCRWGSGVSGMAFNSCNTVKIV